MDRVLFGDNQFFAVNHMSDDKARQQAMQFREDKDIIRVLDHAYDAGIRTFMCTTHDRIAAIADHIRNNPARYPDFKFYPCMPYAHKYANAVTEHGIVGALQDLVKSDVLNLSAKLGKAIATRELHDVMKVLVDLEMRMFKGLDVEVIFLQNVVTDLLLGLGMPHLFSAFRQYVADAYGAEAGFITMNLPALLATLHGEGMQNPVVCASYNISGFRMPGGIESYDQALEQYPCRFIAMQVLAAGALSPTEAIRGVAAKSSIDSILFGASSHAHILQTKALIENTPRTAGPTTPVATKSAFTPFQVNTSLTSLKQCNQFLAHFNDTNVASAGIVFEAGGGSLSHFVRPENSSLVTLDILATQLASHQTATHRIQGDLHRIPLQQNSVQQVICFNVIEHLDDPDAALEEMWQVLAPGGILVLGFPDRNSLKGIITRCTPTWFHRLYYRRIVGKPDGGDGHFDVFSTTFGAVVSGKKIREWLSAKNMNLLFYSAYDGAREYGLTTGSRLRQLIAVPYYGCTFIGRMASLDKWQAAHSDILLIAQKR